MEDAGQTLKVLSLLLQYPDSEIIDALPELERAIGSWSHPKIKTECSQFLAYLQSAPLEELQIEYTAQFDFSPSTCLNLTFHECGDSRKRGSALVYFKELYSREGYHLATSELPDSLPIVLEFLAVCPTEARTTLLSRYGGHIAALAARLKDRSSPYSYPLAALSVLILELTLRGD